MLCGRKVAAESPARLTGFDPLLTVETANGPAESGLLAHRGRTTTAVRDPAFSRPLPDGAVCRECGMKTRYENAVASGM